MKGKHSCSFVPIIGDGNTHVNVPYSYTIGKYFHLKQIALAMKGEPLFLAPRRITDIDFTPGINLGTKTTEYAKGSVTTAQNAARGKLHQLSRTDWKQSWYGVSYKAAAAAYSVVGENSGDQRLWSMTDIPTEEEVVLIGKFYNHWDVVVAQDEWSSEEMAKIFPAAPKLNIVTDTKGNSGQTKKTGVGLAARGVPQPRSHNEDDGQSPESEDDEDDETPGDTAITGSGAGNKGKNVARIRAPVSKASSESEMEVDDDQATRATFLRKVQGMGKSKEDLFEIPTRVEGTSNILLQY